MDRRRFLLGSAALPSAALVGRADDPFAGLPAAAPASIHDEQYWRELRWHFHIPPGQTYCNTGTLGASPKVVTNAMRDHQVFVEQNLTSCAYRPDEPTFLAGYQDEPTLRARVGRLLGGTMEEVALTRNATMGMSYIAMGLQLGRGDEVVLSDQEHAGGRSGYDVRVKRDGIGIVEARIPLPPNDPDAIVAAYAAALTDRTRVVSIPHITSALGIVMPVARIVARVRAHDPKIFVVVDGAQSLGQVPVDVRALDCDAFFSSPHKWLLAPKGTGVLYVRKAGNQRVWTTIASAQWDFQADVGRRFSQIGTGNQSLHKGFEAALDFLERIGMPVIHARIKALGDRLRQGLAEIDGVTIRSSTHPGMCAGMTTYCIRGWTGRQLNDHLWEKDRIMPRAVGDGIRQSLHIYTTFDDVDRTLARVREMAAHPRSGHGGR